MECGGRCARSSLWFSAAVAVLVGAALIVVNGRLGVANARLEASVIGIAVAALFGLVGIPEGSSSGSAPSFRVRIACSTALAAVTLLVLSYPWLRYGAPGLGGCTRLQSVTRASPPMWLSTAYYFFDGSTASLLAVAAVACIMCQHPPSRYVRVTVWAVVGIWMEELCWAATNKMWCAASSGGIELSVFIGIRACGQLLDSLTLCWVVLLVWKRTVALEASFGADLGTRLIGWVTVIAVIAGVLSAYIVFGQMSIVPMPWVSKRRSNVIFSALIGVEAFMILVNALTIGHAFAVPLRIVHNEARKVQGAPRAEAEWAARRLRLERSAAVITSLVTVAKLTCQAIRPFFYHISFDVFWYVDDLVNALSVAILSGLLWQEAPPKTAAPEGEVLRRNLTETSGERDMLARMWSAEGTPEDYCAEWDAKTKELAGRGFTVASLLEFCELLLRREVMPTFDPEKSTTNDVARQAIIPLSRTGDTGCALASVWSHGEPVMAARMVSHSWNNKFVHLVGAVVADGLGEGTFERASGQLATAEGIQSLREQLEKRGSLARTYWICALSINQHASICGGFGPEPPEDCPRHAEWWRKRHDTVSGQPFVQCTCSTRKYFNDEPVKCEMNKFDDMLRFLSFYVPGFQLVAAVDSEFDLFRRAWCVAELVQAFSSSITISMGIPSEDDLDSHYNELSLLDMRECKASRKEDKDMILARILDVDMFNSCLQWLIFGSEGLFKSWLDANSRVGHAGRIARRALRQSSGSNEALGSDEESDEEKGARQRAQFGAGGQFSGSKIWLDARERAAYAGRVAREALHRLRTREMAPCAPCGGGGKWSMPVQSV